MCRRSRSPQCPAIGPLEWRPCAAGWCRGVESCFSWCLTSVQRLAIRSRHCWAVSGINMSRKRGVCCRHRTQVDRRSGPAYHLGQREAPALLVAVSAGAQHIAHAADREGSPRPRSVTKARSSACVASRPAAGPRRRRCLAPAHFWWGLGDLERTVDAAFRPARAGRLHLERAFVAMPATIAPSRIRRARRQERCSP
jgi:hypothetical protein